MVETENPHPQYTGNGVVTQFAYNWPITDKTHIKVTKKVSGVESVLVVDVDYSVQGVGNRDSNTWKITCPISGSPHDSTVHLTLTPNLPYKQKTNFRNQGGFAPETHESAFDYRAVVEQQLKEVTDRCLKAPVSDTSPTTELSTASSRANKMFGFDASGNPKYVADASDSAVAAAASATLAQNWAIKTDGYVSGTDNSSKSWAIGGTGNGQPSAGDAKSWATKTSGNVNGSEFSAKEYAQGSQASTGGSAKNWAQQTGADVTGASANSRSAKSWAQEVITGATLGGSAKDWAQTTGGTVNGTEFSAKEYAVGTSVTAGSAKDWATKTSSTVITGEYSAKEWARGTQTRGAANGGSAKDWANYTGGTVDNAEYSAKKYAQDAAASAASFPSTPFSIANGGTGQTTATAAFDALAPTTTRGDIIYRGASNNQRLAKGSTGQVLVQGANDPAWSAVAAALGLTTQGDLLYYDGSALQRLPKGTSLQQLRMNSGATAPEWATVSTNNDLIVIEDQKSSGTAGGTFTSGAWQTRDLNTEVVDTGNNASVASNQITLAAGTYRCIIRAPGGVDFHQARLYNVTDSAVLLLGSNGDSRSGGDASSDSIIMGRFTLATSKVLEVQHRCNSTVATYGFGFPTSWGTEVYTTAMFWKE